MNTTYLEHKLFYSYEQSNKRITFNLVQFSVIGELNMTCFLLIFSTEIVLAEV